MDNNVIVHLDFTRIDFIKKKSLWISKFHTSRNNYKVNNKQYLYSWFHTSKEFSLAFILLKEVVFPNWANEHACGGPVTNKVSFLLVFHNFHCRIHIIKFKYEDIYTSLKRDSESRNLRQTNFDQFWTWKFSKRWRKPLD